MSENVYVPQRALIVTSKLFDGSAIVASDSVSDAPASNMQSIRPTKRWRSIISAPYVTGSMPLAVVGSGRGVQFAQAPNTLIVGYSNATVTDTLRLRIGTSPSDVTTDPDVDVEFSPSLGGMADLSAFMNVHSCHQFSGSPIAATIYFRIDFQWDQNPDGYVEIGRMMLGPAFQPATSVKAGWVPSGDEDVAETVSMGGEQYPRFMGVRRSLEASWANLTKEEHNALMHILYERGSSRDVALVIDPGQVAFPMTQMAIGRMRKSFQSPHVITLGGDNVEVNRFYEGSGHSIDSGADQRFSFTALVTELATIEMV